jgi:hypothetical protein
LHSDDGVIQHISFPVKVIAMIHFWQYKPAL